MEKNNGSVGAIAGKIKQSKYYKFFEKKIDWKEERKIMIALKRIMYILLIVVEATLMIQLFSSPDAPLKGGALWERFTVMAGACGVISLCNALRLFVLKNSVGKAVCFIFELIASVALIAFSGSNYLIILCLLILTGYYLESKNPKNALAVGILSVPVYIVSYWLAMTVWLGGEISYAIAISDSVWAVIALIALVVR